MFRHRKLVTTIGAETQQDHQHRSHQQQHDVISSATSPITASNIANHGIKINNNEDEERKKLFKIQTSRRFAAKIILFVVLLTLLWWYHINIIQRNDETTTSQIVTREASSFLPPPTPSSPTPTSSITRFHRNQEGQQLKHNLQPEVNSESSIGKEIFQYSSPNTTVITNITTGSLKPTKNKSNNNKVNSNQRSKHPPQYHIVFSTGCSSSQNWQSYVFFYFCHKHRQQGLVTRIVSGCTPEQQHNLQTFFTDAIQSKMSKNFKLHFTPDYSTKNQKYTVYFNKPFGMLHWMKHQFGYGEGVVNGNNSNTTSTNPKMNPNPHDDSIIMLLDPDQIILKPLTHDFSNDTTLKWVERGRNQQSIPRVVQHRSVLAQQYGYGGSWISPKIIKLDELLVDDVETKQSPLWKLTRSTAKKFAAGPPYLATARDMFMIVKTWCDFVPRVHKNFPGLLAEMFAFNLAAHHAHRRPTTASGFMVSRVEDEKTEGWYWIQQNNHNHTTTRDDNVDHPNKNNDNHRYCSNQYPISKQPQYHPYVTHYCQTYKYYEIDYDDDSSFKIIFLKYVIPKNFLSCESDLLQEPTATTRTIPALNGTNNTTTIDTYPASISSPMTSTTTANISTSIQQQRQFFVRHRYMACTIIPAVNEALTHFKRQNCDTNNNGANYEKRLILSESKSYRDHVNKLKKQQLQKEQN